MCQEKVSHLKFHLTSIKLLIYPLHFKTQANLGTHKPIYDRQNHNHQLSLLPCLAAQPHQTSYKTSRTFQNFLEVSTEVLHLSTSRFYFGSGFVFGTNR